MAINCGRKIKKAKRETMLESPNSILASAKKRNFIERFCFQCKMIHEKEVQGPTPGTIWNTKPERENDFFGPIVLILKVVDAESGPALLVAEVSESITQAVETDLVIPVDESSLPFNCIIRSTNMFWTSSKWLNDYIGEVDASRWLEVLRFAFFATSFDGPISPLDYRFVEIDGTMLMLRGGAISGLPVTEQDDPRLEELHQSIRKCQYLSRGVAPGKIHSKQGCEKLWIGNESYSMEPLECEPGVSRIKGKLSLQDITTAIHRDKTKGRNRSLRIEAKGAPPIEAPLAAFEDLRGDRGNACDLTIQTQSPRHFQIASQDMGGETELEETNLRLEAVLASVANDTNVRILSDDSTTALFLHLTPVNRISNPWLIRQCIGLASSMTMVAPPKSKAFTLANISLLEHLVEGDDTPRDINYFSALPPIVLSSLTKASRLQEVGKAINSVSALAEFALASILKSEKSMPSIVKRAQVWTHFLSRPDISPRRLFKIGETLFEEHQVWKEFDSNKEFMQKIASSLKTLRDPAMTTEQRLDSIARLSETMGILSYWEQIENILYCNQFCWPILIVDGMLPTELSRNLAVSLPVAVDISFDNCQSVRLVNDNSNLVSTLETELQECANAARTAWYSMNKTDGSFDKLVENASITFDLRVAEKLATFLASLLGAKIHLSSSGVDEPFVQIILSRLLRLRGLAEIEVTDRIDKHIGAKRGAKYLFGLSDATLRKIDYVSSAMVFPNVSSQINPTAGLHNNWHELNSLDLKQFISECAFGHLNEPRSENCRMDDPCLKDMQNAMSGKEIDRMAKRLQQNNDELPPDQISCENSRAHEIVILPEKQGKPALIRSNDGQEFYFGETDLRGSLEFRKLFNGMQDCIHTKAHGEGTRTTEATDVSAQSDSFREGVIYVIKAEYGLICARNGREYYFSELDLCGDLKFEDISQGMEVRFQVTRDPHNANFTGIAKNVSSTLICDQPYR
jgi:hypothetical protein